MEAPSTSNVRMKKKNLPLPTLKVPVVRGGEEINQVSTLLVGPLELVAHTASWLSFTKLHIVLLFKISSKGLFYKHMHRSRYFNP